MEPSGRNRRQPVADGRTTRTAGKRKSLAVGCVRLPESFHGKEGFDGSSPSGALGEAPQQQGFRCLESHLATASGYRTGTRASRDGAITAGFALARRHLTAAELRGKLSMSPPFLVPGAKFAPQLRSDPTMKRAAPSPNLAKTGQARAEG
jgi:hypothetical protein